MAKLAWIEDDHTEISSLVRLIEIEGHSILPYGSLQEVEDNIEIILACDGIILDIILPTIDEEEYVGLTLLNKLRKEHHYEKPVVVCSRIQNPVVIDQLKELGISDIVRKPARPSTLAESVRRALGGD